MSKFFDAETGEHIGKRELHRRMQQRIDARNAKPAKPAPAQPEAVFESMAAAELKRLYPAEGTSPGPAVPPPRERPIKQNQLSGPPLRPELTLEQNAMLALDPQRGCGYNAGDSPGSLRIFLNREDDDRIKNMPPTSFDATVRASLEYLREEQERRAAPAPR